MSVADAVGLTQTPKLPPRPASHIGFKGISDMPHPNLLSLVTDLTNTSDREGGLIGFAKRNVYPLADTEPARYRTRSQSCDAVADSRMQGSERERLRKAQDFRSAQ
jgi:hypothetical protein